MGEATAGKKHRFKLKMPGAFIILSDSDRSNAYLDCSSGKLF